MVEHRLEPGAADVAIGRAVNRVAELHVVGRHRFCDRAGGAADLKKSPRHFLAGANFGKRSVAFPIEIDLERLLVRSDIHLRVHRFKMKDNAAFSTEVSLRPYRRPRSGSDGSRLRSQSIGGKRTPKSTGAPLALWAGIQPRRSLGKAA